LIGTGDGEDAEATAMGAALAEATTIADASTLACGTFVREQAIRITEKRRRTRRTARGA
jgi:hypothetical protein